MGGATRVGPQARREYLDRMRERYESAGREAASATWTTTMALRKRCRSRPADELRPS